MATLPLNVTSFGVGSDKLGDEFHIFFLSCHTSTKLYLSEGELTDDLSKALTTDNMEFITDELRGLLDDQDFMDYLEASLVF